MAHPLNTPARQQIKAIAAALGSLGGMLVAGMVSPYLPFSADMEAATVEGLTLAFNAALTLAAGYLATWLAPRNQDAA